MRQESLGKIFLAFHRCHIGLDEIVEHVWYFGRALGVSILRGHVKLAEVRLDLVLTLPKCAHTRLQCTAMPEKSPHLTGG